MKHISNLSAFLSSVYNRRYVFQTLVIRDFKGRYMGSFVGLPWAFIQPSINVLIIWFAFTYGLKTGNTVSGLPFAPWLLAGMIPWLFISQTMIVTCLAIPEYGYLIKKMALNVWIIPLIKIFSGLVVHLILVCTILVLFILFYGIYPTVYWFQIFYYVMATIILLTGIAWLVSSINVLVQDMSHIVNIVTGVLFWATPIIWPYQTLSGNLKYIALLNPFSV
jgi:lipopolysaccharide transport system permease protein/teichoic acid transport system permease protein